jgi:phosphoglycerate kinase
VEDPVLVLGGAKAADIVKMIDRMGDRASTILLGGIPGDLALHLTGHDIGVKYDWIQEKGFDEAVEELERVLKQHDDKIVLPKDLQTESGNVVVEEFPADQHVWDIGEETRREFVREIEDATAVMMKGPMGAFEQGFEDGTRTVLDAVRRSTGYSVIGGGHTSSLLQRYGHEIDDFSHVSIAGGAFVRFMSGEELDVIRALREHA